MEQGNKQILGRTLLVTLHGELDLVSAESVRESIDTELEKNSRIKNLVVDLAEVEFIDSSGLGMLLGRYRQVHRRGGKLVLIGPKPQVRRVLEMAGITKIMRIVATRQEALADL